MEKIKKINKCFPFIVLFIIMLILHSKTFMYADDLFFSEQIHTNLFNYLLNRYDTWTSRVLLELLLVVLASSNIIIWRICNSLIYVLIAYSLSKLFIKDASFKANILIVLIVMLYPIIDMNSAGWLATTLNYIWPLAFGLYALTPLRNIETKEKIKWYKYLLYIPALLLACNQEQMCAIIFGISLLLVLYYLIIKKEKSYNYLYILLVISLIGLISILACPGNSLRMKSETDFWLPWFNSMGIPSKIQVSFLTMYDILILNRLVLCLFGIYMCYYLVLNSKEKITKIIAIINAILVGCLTLGKDIITKLLPFMKDFYANLDYQDPIIKGNLFSDSNVSGYLTFVLIFLLLGLTIYLICKTFGKNFLLPLIIYLAGFTSRFIIGFSPTIYASGARTMIFFYFSILSLMIMIYELLKPKHKNILIFITIIFALTNMINMYIKLL